MFMLFVVLFAVKAKFITNCFTRIASTSALSTCELKRCAGEERMSNRRPVKDAHECFLVDAFISWWESQKNEQFHVISRPEPPEAIVRSDQRTTWIEVTDAFHSDEWAKDLYSNATPGETHEPMGPGPYVGMDAQSAARFAALLKKKLSKESYADAYKKHGPGILLVGMQSPWFNADTCEMMRNECQNIDWSTNRGYFSHVFISFSSLNQQTFEEWKLDAQQTGAANSGSADASPEGGKGGRG